MGSPSIPTATLLIDLGVLVDTRALGAVQPDALAHVLAERCGSPAEVWRAAYQQILHDWDSYWADLDLGSDDSLAQWREGRWRVIRAHFRLAGHKTPPLNTIPIYLDELPYEVGYRCNVWRPGAVGGLRALARLGARVVILTPFQAASLVQGMLEAAGAAQATGAVLGPDELGQAGLGGLAWPYLTHLAGGDPTRSWLVGGEQLPDAPYLAPPADLSGLPDLLTNLE